MSIKKKVLTGIGAIVTGVVAILPAKISAPLSAFNYVVQEEKIKAGGDLPLMEQPKTQDAIDKRVNEILDEKLKENNTQTTKTNTKTNTTNNDKTTTKKETTTNNSKQTESNKQITTNNKTTNTAKIKADNLTLDQALLKTKQSKSIYNYYPHAKTVTIQASTKVEDTISIHIKCTNLINYCNVDYDSYIWQTKQTKMLAEEIYKTCGNSKYNVHIQMYDSNNKPNEMRFQIACNVNEGGKARIYKSQINKKGDQMK